MAVIKRRETPPHYIDYRSYKPFLRIDFKHRCCYCTVHESNWGTERHFAVEHFRPKSKFLALITTYSNLYYACDVCNGYKGDKWPSPLDDAAGRRFFDPCSDRSNSHFTDHGSGELTALSPCGVYSVDSVRLNRPQLIRMRNQRREYATKFRRLLREVRHFKAAKLTADPSAQPIIALLIRAYEDQLAESRARFYRPLPL